MIQPELTEIDPIILVTGVAFFLTCAATFFSVIGIATIKSFNQGIKFAVKSVLFWLVFIPLVLIISFIFFEEISSIDE